VLGTTLDLNRRHARAEALLRRGAAIFEERLGSRSPSFASCIASLASVLVWRSKLEEGERLLQRALAIHRTAGSPSDDVVDALNSLGWLYCHMGRFRPAKRCYREALALAEASPGRPPRCLAALLDNLACLASHHGDRRRADAYFRRSLEAHNAEFGAEHPVSIGTVMRLAHTVAHQDPATAARMVIDSFTIAKRRLDPGNICFREILDVARGSFQPGDPRLGEIERYALARRRRPARG